MTEEEEIKQKIANLQSALNYDGLMMLARKAEQLVRQKEEIDKPHLCIFCEKLLEHSLPEGTGSSFQPHAGGEVFFAFCFGSTKFDNYMNGTTYLGYTCDDCAEKYVSKMKDVTGDRSYPRIRNEFGEPR